MNDVYMFIYSALLFFVLTPGILFTLPPNLNNKIVALVNGIVFAIILNFTHKTVLEWLNSL